MSEQSQLGRAAVVTGAARGIGFAVAERLVSQGMSCALWDIDQAAHVGPTGIMHIIWRGMPR